jgi:hydroxyacylglutathione hydrolase
MKNTVKVFSNAKFKEVNAFVISDPNTKSAVVIDTAFGMVEEISTYVKENELEVNAIIITHSHFDHFVGLNDLSDIFSKAEVYITLDDLPGLFNPILNFSEIFNTEVGTYVAQQPKNLKVLMYDKEYNFDGVQFKVLRENGHTKGSVMLDFMEDKIIFSGDILLGERADKAQPDIADNTDVVEENIRLIFKNYDSSYSLYPSHFGVDFKLGDIMKYNIRVQRILAMK